LQQFLAYNHISNCLQILNLTSSLLADVTRGVYECTRYASQEESALEFPEE